MKICLIYPINTDQPQIMDSPHMGLAYIAASLRQNGYEVDIYDGYPLNMTKGDLFNRIQRNLYSAIGISVYYYNYSSVLPIAQFIRKHAPNTFLFYGGYYPTLSFRHLKSDFSIVDCMVIGEGELTLLHLMENIDNDNWKKVKGIAYRTGDEIIYTGKCNSVNNLDLLPFPRHLKLDKEVHIITSRGCFFRCSFCSLHKMIEASNCKIIRKRSPENVILEIETILEETSAIMIRIEDDNFAYSTIKDKVWFNKFYDLILEKNINIKFACQMRVNEMNIEFLHKFKKIGLSYIYIGIESFIQEHLDFYNKKTTVEQNLECIKKLDDLKINYHYGLMLFNPITNLSDIKKTIRIMREHIKKTNMIHISKLLSDSYCLAMSGTDIETYIVNNNLKKGISRGYLIKDKKSENCFQIMQYWVNKVKNFLRINQYRIDYEKAKKDVFLTDLDVLKEIVELLDKKNNNDIQVYYSLIDNRFNDLIAKIESVT